MGEPQTLGADDSKSIPAAVSWTGGKDCNLALFMAWRHPRYNVTSLVVFRNKDSKFRAHPMEIMEKQALNLGLPLLVALVDTENGKLTYKEAYVCAMRKLKNEHGIEAIVTGDMDLVGTMERNFIQECGEVVEMETYLPLWQADRADCLRKLIDEKFQIVFTCVKSPWFDVSWIGRTIDESALNEMKDKSSAAPDPLEKQDGDGNVVVHSYKPLDLGGERGEYHTMCIDGPLYRTPVDISGVTALQPVELSGHFGEKNGERWWVIGFDENM